MNRIDWSQGWEIITNVTDTATEVYCRTEAQANAEHAMKVHFGEKPSPVRYDGETDSYTFVVNHDEDAPKECPDCGSTNGPALCVAGKCLTQSQHTECNNACVAVKAEIDQAAAGTDSFINGHAKEIRNQLESGYNEEDIMLGMYDFLANYTAHSRGEFITLYMRAVLKLAKSNEKGDK